MTAKDTSRWLCLTTTLDSGLIDFGVMTMFMCISSSSYLVGEVFGRYPFCTNIISLIEFSSFTVTFCPTSRSMPRRSPRTWLWPRD